MNSGSVKRTDKWWNNTVQVMRNNLSSYKDPMVILFIIQLYIYELASFFMIIILSDTSVYMQKLM